LCFKEWKSYANLHTFEHRERAHRGGVDLGRPEEGRKGDQSLWRYRPGGRPEEKATKKIAAQTNFYELREIDPNDNDIEEMSSQIEGVVAWDLKKLRAGTINLRQQQKAHLAGYFALQYTRTPWFRELSNKSVTSIHRVLVKAAVEKPGAVEKIALIQQLYQVEHAAADLDPDGRRALRQDQSVPLLAKIDAERQALARTVLPKSPLGEAVRYLTNQWAALQRFVEDGRLAIDNNRAENQLRVVAVGRKNWLFAGSFEGARRAALLYSIVQSCKLVDVAPFLYLKDVLLRIATHPHRLIDQLTPKRWAEAFGPQPSALIELEHDQ
jgi:hypothetical protein